MSDINKYTFEIVGLSDDAHDIPLRMPKKLKGVEISTLHGNIEDAEQSAMSMTHSLIKELDSAFTMDGTKKIKLKLKSVDPTWEIEHGKK